MAEAPSEEPPVKQPEKPKLLQVMGPGLITGASDDDPSGIATYSQVGAQFGYGLAWSLPFSYPLMVAIQEISARIGRVTGIGVAGNLRRHYPKSLASIIVLVLLVANVINLGADLNAMGDVAALLVGAGSGSGKYFVIGFGLVSLLLQVFVPYRRYVTILKWLTLPLLAYVGLALVVHVNWLQALHGIVWPSLRWDKDYLSTIVAIFGTTISPYLFFWQASQEVEEIERIPEDRALCEEPGQVRQQFRRIRLDTYVGMGFSNLIAFFMIVATAATLHAQGVTHIESTTQAASALKPIAGEFAFALFALGIIGTGLLALPVLAGSAAYAVSSVFGWQEGLGLELRQAKPFYGVIALAMIIGVLLAGLGWNPISALYWSAVLNAVIAVPIMVAVMVAASHPRVMGPFCLARKWVVLGWAATAVMAVATVAMFVSMAM